MKNEEEIDDHERKPALTGMTLEDFLAKAGIFSETSSDPVTGLNAVDLVSPLSRQRSLLSSPSIGTLSDTSLPGRKRSNASGDAPERTVERRLRRKIKNRESAARSRARKQAYHNELVIKVSRLEEANLKLKKEKEVETIMPCESSSETKYQLRRTSSASF